MHARIRVKPSIQPQSYSVTRYLYHEIQVSPECTGVLWANDAGPLIRMEMSVENHMYLRSRRDSIESNIIEYYYPGVGTIFSIASPFLQRYPHNTQLDTFLNNTASRS